ncbi:MAG: antibiotic biosynthesis monooxygenase family protein [Ilumatobacteraceae bacterium]
MAGTITVDSGAREQFLSRSRSVTIAARSADGNLDFHLAADPIEPDRVNVFEAWESIESVEAFRGDGPDREMSSGVRAADVRQYEVAGSIRL